MTIRIWNAETGAAVGEPLQGHTGLVTSVAYSPNGRNITSGSCDETTRIWDTASCAAVRKPLGQHMESKHSVVHSAHGSPRIPGSGGETIQIWDPETSNHIQNPLIEHAAHTAESSIPQQIITASHHNNAHALDTSLSPSVHLSLHDTIPAALDAMPDLEGWVNDTMGGLLYWVPPDCRTGLHSPALLTLPRDSGIRSVSLTFDDVAFGTSWAHIFTGAHL